MPSPPAASGATVADEVGTRFPDVKLEHQLVDPAPCSLSPPRHFDVMVTDNIFGDILSDEAAVLTGSLGMLPTASLGAARRPGMLGLYEPIHGTAPDIAGRGHREPLGGNPEGGHDAALVVRAGQRGGGAHRVRPSGRTLTDGIRTGDLIPKGSEAPFFTRVGTKDFLAAVRERLAAAFTA